MTTRTAVGPWLRRHFPKAPSRQELYVRLPLVVLGVVALSSMGSLEALGANPLSRGALVSAGRCSSIVVRVSNADSAKISLIVRDLRLAPFSPKTFAEKIGWIVPRFILLVLVLVALLIVLAVALVLTTRFSSWQLARAELLWVGFSVLAMAVLWILGRYVERYETNLRKLLRQPGRSDTDDEMTVRRTLRTIAFVLFFVSTACQLVAVALTG